MRCYIDRGLGHYPKLVLHISRCFGICIERYTLPSGKRYLTAVIWIPRDLARTKLRYFYPSIRSI